METITRRRSSWAMPGALSLVMLAGLVSTGPGTALAATAQDALPFPAAALGARAALGLPVDADAIRALAQPGADVGTAEWGIPMTAAEDRAVDLPGRMAFANAVSDSLPPALRSLPTFGGVWIDQKGGGGLVVALTGIDAQASSLIASRTPSPSRGIAIRQVFGSRTELQRAVERLAQTPPAGFGSRFLGAGLDEEANAVRLYVTPEAASAAAASPAVAAQVGVPLVVVPETPGRDVSCTTRTNCVDPYKPGIRIRPGSRFGPPECTMAFFIVVASDIQALTAGHCGHYGSAWYHPTIGQNTNPDGKVGSVQSSLYKQGGKDVLRISALDREASVDVYGFQNAYDEMRDSRDPILNEVVCAPLSMSDANACGTVVDVYRSWVSETMGYTVYGADENGFTPIVGDSGSPVYTRFTMPAKPGVPQHSVFTPIGVVDHEKGYFAIVDDALAVWGRVHVPRELGGGGAEAQGGARRRVRQRGGLRKDASAARRHPRRHPRVRHRLRPEARLDGDGRPKPACSDRAARSDPAARSVRRLAQSLADCHRRLDRHADGRGARVHRVGGGRGREARHRDGTRPVRHCPLRPLGDGGRAAGA